jgi:hypothetical protein
VAIKKTVPIAQDCHVASLLAKTGEWRLVAMATTPLGAGCILRRMYKKSSGFARSVTPGESAQSTSFRLCKPVQSGSFAFMYDVGWSLRRAREVMNISIYNAKLHLFPRHCEERSDVANPRTWYGIPDCHVASRLAMTREGAAQAGDCAGRGHRFPALQAGTKRELCFYVRRRLEPTPSEDCFVASPPCNDGGGAAPPVILHCIPFALPLQ